WFPGHKNIFGNDIADKLAKKGLGRKPIGTSFTSLSYIKRKGKEKILSDWKQSWEANSKKQGKHYTRICRDLVRFSLGIPGSNVQKKIQAAYFQLKTGIGFFKSYSKVIGKDEEGKCFRDCQSLQTPTHLILHCAHYSKECKEMRKELRSKLTM
ncbi:hypothetical protein M501DRAFT_923061, partial [Patellaria atrata CBS 101060]